MDSALILCFLVGLRLTQALTPDEYINLRKHNQSPRKDAIRPSAVTVFVRPLRNEFNAKMSRQQGELHRPSDNFQVASPSERYNQYREQQPTVPKKQHTPRKPAFAVAKYDDYYPVRKPVSKSKPVHASSPAAKTQKRPVPEYSRDREMTEDYEEDYPEEGAYDIPDEKRQRMNEETSNKGRKAHRGNIRDEKKDTKSMSASEQVQKLISRSEDDKLFVAATGYGGKTRGQFHEQGMEGPHSYKFGYNTGDSFNPMARYEERDADGFVRGSYSFVDPLGKLQVVHYESHPELGFKTKSGHGSYPY